MKFIELIDDIITGSDNVVGKVKKFDSCKNVTIVRNDIYSTFRLYGVKFNSNGYE